MTLDQLFERKPLVLIRLPEKFGDAYRCSRYGLAKFTLTKPHGALEGMKLPALCLIEMQDKEKPMCYVRIARSKKPIATLELRLMLAGLQPLDLTSLDELNVIVSEKRFEAALKEKLKKTVFASVLTPKLSGEVIQSPFLSSFAAMVMVNLTRHTFYRWNI